MKKLFLGISIMMLALCVNNSSAQTFVREGNTFKSVTKRAVADTLLTNLTVEDSKSKHLYPIILNKASGRCWCWRKSSRTGKMYKRYLSADIAREVCKSYNVTYKEK